MFLGLAIVAAGPVQAELYKWTDGEGKVHYSDQPPSSAAHTVNRTATGQSAITREAQKALDEKDEAYRKRKKAADEARAKTDAEAEQARIKRENCDKARKNLDVLRTTPRVYSTNPAGQRVYMDDDARADALASSQKAISENCP